MSTKKISEITDKATSTEVSTAKIVAAIPSGDGHVTKYLEGSQFDFSSAELIFNTFNTTGIYSGSTSMSGHASTLNQAGSITVLPGKTYRLVNASLAKTIVRPRLRLAPQ
jgi:hypothetical protein